MTKKSSLASVLSSTFNEDISYLKLFIKREVINCKLSKYKPNLLLVFELREKYKFLKLKKMFKKEEKEGLLKLLINKNNSGFSNCLNFGIMNCDSKYILRLDTDDISTKDRYDKQIDSMIKNECYLSYSDLIDISSNKIIKAPAVKNIYISLILGTNPIPHVSVCFDRNFFIENIGLYNSRLNKSEDFEYWMRYILRFGLTKIVKEKQAMTYYNTKGSYIKSRESAIKQIYIRSNFIKNFLLYPFILLGIFPNLIRIIFPKFIIKLRYFITSRDY